MADFDDPLTAYEIATRKTVPLETAYEDIIDEIVNGSLVTLHADVRGGKLQFTVDKTFIYPDTF